MKFLPEVISLVELQRNAVQLLKSQCVVIMIKKVKVIGFDQGWFFRKKLSRSKVIEETFDNSFMAHDKY